jgi:hypothetical protein
MLNLDIKNHSNVFTAPVVEEWLDNKTAKVRFDKKVPASVLEVAYRVREITFAIDGKICHTFEVLLVLECDLNNPYNETTQKKMDMSKDILSQLSTRLAV